MTPLAARVVRGLQAEGLAGPGDRVVVALSGGADSVALTGLLSEALPPLGAHLAGVAHLHHGLRGAEADGDEDFCRALAVRLGVPCDVERLDVGALSRAGRVSIEAAGHEARYAFYARARARLGATLVATGHTRNDLAETFLLRALRGAGLRGLAGIAPSRASVIRPLLDVSRAEVLDYLAARGQAYREDATNRDTRIPRNRIRHELLPWLERHVSPGAVTALARTARLAADDEAWLQEQATDSTAVLVLADGDGLAFETARLATLPPALRRRLVLSSLEGVTGRRVGLASVERVLALLDRPGGAVQVPGGRASEQGGRLTLRASEPRPAAPRVGEAPATRLCVPGTVDLPAGGRVEAEVRPASAAPQGAGAAPGTDVALLDASRVRQPLEVRFRWPGARLRPLGMAGRKKLQDLFVDRKVPRPERDRVPLVVDADGRIVWVAGHVVAEDARVTGVTTSVLLLKYRR